MKNPFPFLAVALAASVSSASAAPLLNEVHLNAPGAEDTKYQYVEILTVDAQGKPVSESLDGLSVLLLDSNGSTVGSITVALNLNGKKTGTNGLLLIGAGFTKTGPFAGVAAETEVVDLAGIRAAGSDLELGPKSGMTAVLVRNFTGKPQDDVDANNTGRLNDRVPWTALVDAIGFGDKPYDTGLAATVTFGPDNLSRINGVTAKSRDAWYGGEMNDTIGGPSLSFTDQFFGPFTGSATPGSPNRTQPSVNPVRISEVMVNPTARVGDNNFEYIELSSVSGAVESTNDLWLLIVDSHNNGGVVGEVLRAFNLNGHATGVNGLMLIGNNYTRANNPWSSLVEKDTEVFEPEGLFNDDIGDNDGFTILLVKKFTGAAKTAATPGTDLDPNNDGVLDQRPWDTTVGQGGILDSVGSSQLEPTAAGTVAKVLAKTYALVDLVQNTAAASYVPDLIFRKPTDSAANSAAAWVGGELAGKGITGIGLDRNRTFGGYRGVATPGKKNVAATPPQELVLINEVHIDPPVQPDGIFEYIELLSPNRSITALNDLHLIIVDMVGAQRGTLKSVIDINGYSTGNNGLLLIGDNYDDSSALPSGYDVAGATDREDPQGFDGGDIGPSDNSGLALFLVQGFTGVRGQDLDTNDDGALDVKPWASVMDAVGFGVDLKQTADIANLNGKTNDLVPDSLFRVPGNFAQNDAGAWMGGTLVAGTPATLKYDKVFGPFQGEATPGRLNTAGPRLAASPLINEAHVNPPGNDDNYEFVELISPSGGRQSTNNLTLLMIDGAGAKGGNVLEAWDLDGMSTGADGILTLGNRYAPTPETNGVIRGFWDRALSSIAKPNTPYGDEVNTKVSAVGYPPGFGSDVLPSAPLNLLLVEGFTGFLGQDLDTNDDGQLDARPWKLERGIAGVLDSLGFRNWVNSTSAYEGKLYSPTDVSRKEFTPDNLARLRGNFQANSASAWYGGDIAGDLPSGTTYGVNYFGLLAKSTPGALNLGDVSSDALDDDKDGVNNGAEKTAGTNPLDPNDYLRMNAAARAANGVGVTWRSVASRSYVVEYTDELKKDSNWKVISAAPIPGTATEARFTDTDPIRLSKSTGFYRVRVSQ